MIVCFLPLKSPAELKRETDKVALRSCGGFVMTGTNINAQILNEWRMSEWKGAKIHPASEIDTGRQQAPATRYWHMV